MKLLKKNRDYLGVIYFPGQKIFFDAEGVSFDVGHVTYFSYITSVHVIIFNERS